MNIRKITLEQCPLCDSKNIKFVLTSSDFDTNTGDYSVYQCETCKIHFTNPQIDSRDLSQLYLERVSGEFLPESSSLIEKLRRWRAASTAKSFFKQLGIKDVSILDIGCGDGLYSVALAQHPACKDISALDFHETPPKHIANLGISNISYQHIDHLTQDNKTYDVIFCRHLLEHTQNPIHFLRMIKPLLKEGGKIFIEVPNFECVWQNILRGYYVNLYLPRHFYHFERKTLKNVIESAGFKVDVIFFGHLPSLGWSIRNMTGLRPLRKIGVLEIALFPIEVGINILFRQATCLGVIVKKYSPSGES